MNYEEIELILGVKNKRKELSQITNANPSDILTWVSSFLKSSNFSSLKIDDSAPSQCEMLMEFSLASGVNQIDPISFSTVTSSHDFLNGFTLESKPPQRGNVQLSKNYQNQVLQNFNGGEEEKSKQKKEKQISNNKKEGKISNEVQSNKNDEGKEVSKFNNEGEEQGFYNEGNAPKRKKKFQKNKSQKK